MFCSNCGGKLEDNARFCPICGTKVEEVQPSFDTPVVNNQPQDVFANPEVNSQPQDVFANPEVNNQPQDVFANPEVNNQIQNPYAPVNGQPQDPFAPVNGQPQDPFAPVNGQPQDPFAPVNGQPQDPIMPVNGQPQDNQWNPLMESDKKSKKPLIIGLICAALAIVIIVVIIVLFACSGGNDKKKEKDTTKSGTQKETTTEAPTDNKLAGSEDEIAKQLFSEYMDAIKNKDLDSYKRLFIEEVYNQLLEDQIYGDLSTLTDAEILVESLKFDLKEFGDITEYTINNIEQSYSSDGNYESSKYGLTGDSAITNSYTYEGTVTISSDVRTATFDFSFYLYERSKDNLEYTLDSVNIDNYSFLDYDYSYTGEGRDDYRWWYDFDYVYQEPTDKPVSGEPSTDKPISGEPSTDKPVSGEPSTDDISIKDYINMNGVGESSVDKIVEESLKATLSMDYSQIKECLFPVYTALYDMMLEYGVLTEEDIIEAICNDAGVYKPVEFEKVRFEQTDLGKEEIDAINSELHDEESFLYSEDITVDDAKGIEGTVTYKYNNTESKSISFEMEIISIDNKWYLAYLELADEIN